MLQTTGPRHAASFFPALGGDLPTIVRAEGIYMYDDAGRQLIDAAGGVGAVTSIGHAVPDLKKIFQRPEGTGARAPSSMVTRSRA